MSSRAQIIATIGPASQDRAVFSRLVQAGVDVVRFNFAWSDNAERKERLAMVREVAAEQGKRLVVVADIPGPRVQREEQHTYDPSVPVFSPEDAELVAFCVAERVDYIAQSYVASKTDVLACRAAITAAGGNQKIIAKIERVRALENLDEIIAVADAIMVARGDLGHEVPLEDIPKIQKHTIEKTRAAGKPVIVATQMMLSMTEHDVPTRAEVTDVDVAILEGADAVMLSEETSLGKYPVETVTMMERILQAAEKEHAQDTLHPL